MPTIDGRVSAAGRARQRLLVVEDDARLGPLTVEMLSPSYVVELAVDAAAGYQAARRGGFVAMVLDRRLPDGDGLDLVRQLRREGNPIPVILLTALGSLEDRVDGLDAGADDYLVKPFASAELLARLRAITRSHLDGETVFMIGDWEFRPSDRIINSPYAGRTVLSRTESELLHLLVRYPDQTLSRERILSEVFPTGDGPGTVDTYVHYLRRKTEREIITTVRGLGYRIGRL